MDTLSYGYQRPADGDRASVWMPALKANVTKMNDHNHDGSNSAALTPSSIAKYSHTKLAADWVSAGGGNYTMDITVPGGITEINNFIPKFINNTTGELLYLSMTRLTATTYRVAINDNTIDLLIKYG